MDLYVWLCTLLHHPLGHAQAYALPLKMWLL
jgi:hypothetical protein